ncbi:DUF3017 domain-containing protein [Enemella sp. A6]|uniref:DUF3017 domain-containing protein n=1 Tax=Enemella sp. A6 TaxID=3440152 RepID=UPI003EC12F8C
MPEEARLAARAAALTQKQWPLLLVLAVVLTGLVLAWWWWPVGLLVFSGGLLLGALLRLVLPRREVGLLAVRGRIFDVIFLLVCGVGLLVLVLARL